VAGAALALAGGGVAPSAGGGELPRVLLGGVQPLARTAAKLELLRLGLDLVEAGRLVGGQATVLELGGLDQRAHLADRGVALFLQSS
jgi:hypothetical protein